MTRTKKTLVAAAFAVALGLGAATDLADQHATCGDTTTQDQHATSGDATADDQHAT